jgi:hypothetical protein
MPQGSPMDSWDANYGNLASDYPCVSIQGRHRYFTSRNSVCPIGTNRNRRPNATKSSRRPCKFYLDKTGLFPRAICYRAFHSGSAFQNDWTSRAGLEVAVNVWSDPGVQPLGQLVFGFNSSNQNLEIISIEVRKPGSCYLTSRISFSFMAQRSSIFLVSECVSFSSSSTDRLRSSSLIFFSFSSFSTASLMSRRMFRTAVR